MKSTRHLTLIGFMLLVFAMPAFADKNEDREDIKALMWHYARALDTFDADAYAALYTPDGQFGSGNRAAKGTQALKDMIIGVKEGREKRMAAGEKVPKLYHMTADSWIEFIDSTHAIHHSYWLTLFAGEGEGASTTIAAAGVGADHLVKVKGRWLIEMRDVAAQ